MGLAQPDQTLEHANRFAVFADSRVLPQELIVGVQDQLSVFSHDWLEYFLDEVDVLAELGGAPGLFPLRLALFEVWAAQLQDMLRSLHIFHRIVAVDQHKNQVEPAQQARLDARIRVYVKLWVPLLPGRDGICSGNYRRSRVNLSDNARLGN